MVDTFDRLPAEPAMRRMSWGSVLAGVAVALAAQLMFGVLGLGIGASALHPSQSVSARSFGAWGAVYLFITTLLSLFAGGWVAGRLAALARPVESALHGVLTWALSTMVVVYVLTTAIGGIFSGAGALLGNVVGAAGGGIAAAAPSLTKVATSQLSANGVTVDSLAKQFQGALAAPEARHAIGLARGAAARSATDPQSAQREANDLIYRVVHDTGTTSSSADRTKLIQVVAEREHVSTARATTTVDGWQAEARSARQALSSAAQSASEATKQAGDAAASGVATTGITAFFFLLLGAAAAAFGGVASLSRPATRRVATSRT